MPSDGLLEVGRIGRAHGVRGDVLVHLTTDRVERLAVGDALRDVVLRAEPIDDPGTLWVHQLIGSEVVEVAGTRRGQCVAVVDNPAADLLELESGALVPATFVVSFADGVVTIDPPEGLFELGA